MTRSFLSNPLEELAVVLAACMTSSIIITRLKLNLTSFPSRYKAQPPDSRAGAGDERPRGSGEGQRRRLEL
ncbi:hypothetical protein E2C01_082430 [Portunus trituberculatus]|uniref:Uncharacterized protein n=1 Tax=Portunus trituberculatus TaxID=210409 RepID=A0A5B7J4X9_PORTR|nr:hypothetical protein [Portunus trituberculatus]